MSDLQTLSGQKLPRGVSEMSAHSLSNIIFLKFSSYNRINQFYRLHIANKPFNLGVILGMEELSRIKCLCVHINSSYTELKVS